MSTHLERLVTEWRDAKRARHAIIERAMHTLNEVTPYDVAIANTRATAASVALLRYAEEEMG